MVWRDVREEVLLQGISGGTLTRRLESGSNVGYLLCVCTSRRGLVQTAPPYHRCTLLWLRCDYAARRVSTGLSFFATAAGSGVAGLVVWKRASTSFVVSCSRVFGLCSFRVALLAS